MNVPLSFTKTPVPAFELAAGLVSAVTCVTIIPAASDVSTPVAVTVSPAGASEHV